MPQRAFILPHFDFALYRMHDLQNYLTFLPTLIKKKKQPVPGEPLSVSKEQLAMLEENFMDLKNDDGTFPTQEDVELELEDLVNGIKGYLNSISIFLLYCRVDSVT